MQQMQAYEAALAEAQVLPLDLRCVPLWDRVRRLPTFELAFTIFCSLCMMRKPVATSLLLDAVFPCSASLLLLVAFTVFLLSAAGPVLSQRCVILSCRTRKVPELTLFAEYRAPRRGA